MHLFYLLKSGGVAPLRCRAVICFGVWFEMVVCTAAYSFLFADGQWFSLELLLEWVGARQRLF